VTQLLYAEDRMHVDDVIEVPDDASQLAGDVSAQRGRDFDVVTCQVQLHERGLPSLTVRVGSETCAHTAYAHSNSKVAGRSAFTG
jgi:hypothetical protein